MKRKPIDLLASWLGSLSTSSVLNHPPAGTAVDGSANNDADRTSEIDVMLEEYRTVRQEELVGMQSQISTLRYGITGCVVLIGLAAQQHADRYLGWSLALALVPLVILFSAVIWMGEYERMARAGRYVGILERDINHKVGALSGGPLGWEKWLREGGHAQSRIVGGHHRYLAIASVFLGLHVTAVAMGLHFYWHQHADDPSRRWLVPAAALVNVAILLTLVGYFRSSYERLRNFTADPDEHMPDVRQRLRMRLRLYGVFGAVGFVSAPIWSWPLGIYSVRKLNDAGWLGHVPAYWIGWPVVVWMVLVPLLASRAVMRELLQERTLAETAIGSSDRATLQRSGALDRLTDWESRRVHIVRSAEVNAPSIGRSRSIAVTTGSLAHEAGLAGVFAHEVGHHRLHHLHPLALSYLYLWPYFYYDDKVARVATRGSRLMLARALRRATRVLFTIAVLPGWMAWVMLRYGWRTAEYDADRYACLSGSRAALEAALLRGERLRQQQRPTHWRDRLAKGWERIDQGRALGYLPVPNEHPTPMRRLDSLQSWQWTRERGARRGVGGPEALPPVPSTPPDSR